MKLCLDTALAAPVTESPAIAKNAQAITGLVSLPPLSKQENNYFQQL